MRLVNLFITFILLVIAILMYISMQSHDISLQPSPPIQNKQPVYLMSYADGPEIFIQNQNAMAESAINKGIDFIFNYRKHHLDPTFVANNADIFERKQGAGLWIWKPWLILKTLQSMPEDAVLIYGDSNTIFKRPVHNLVELANSHEIILLEHPNLTREQEIQLTTLEKLGCNDKSCRDGKTVVACFMVLKNTKTTRTFIEQWLANCENREIFLDDNRESPNLVRHIYDQSVLGAMAHQHRDKVKLLKYTFLRDNYIATAYRKPGDTEFYTQDAEIFRYSILGRLEYKLSNTKPLVKLRKFILTNVDSFPWRATYYKQNDLTKEIIEPS